VAEFKGRLIGGMFSAKSNTFVPIETCIVHETDVEAMKHAILKVLNKHHFPEFSRSANNGIRYILLRGFKQQVQCTLVTGDETLNPRLIDDLMDLEGLVSLYHSINSDRHSHEALGKDIFHIAGDPTLLIYINAVKYQLSPKAFFQLNLAQATNIFRKVRNLITDGDSVMDAYCGVGALSLQLCNKAKQVVGVENNRFAIRNAKENALLNSIENISFICEDAAVALEAYQEPLDVLIVDPPRSGLDEAMCAAILAKQIPHLIYVSCNPTSLAKNLSELIKGYTINSITPYDLFSQTPLLECVVDLVLNQSV
ncbi:MAG: methyltransferase domain-containing protein, partial [archaeon]